MWTIVPQEASSSTATTAVSVSGDASSPVYYYSIGDEKKRLCTSRVTITLYYKDGSGAMCTKELSDGDTTQSFSITYDRSTGLYKSVKVNGVEVTGSVPMYLTCQSGKKTYYLKFIQDTGKYEQIRVSESEFASLLNG